MILITNRAAVRGMLTAVLIVASPVTDAQKDRLQRLGVVNGQIKGNQVVEVRRSLTDPVLYKVENIDALPQTLRVRNATARDAEGGGLWLTVSQAQPDSQKISAVTAHTTLWIDGKSVPLTFSQQGTDVLVRGRENSKPKLQVMLRSDAPVTLQVPVNWRGPVEVVMEITGE
ncbi:fimbrial protein [Citrobacter freundii]|nr:fimbrial protein [Citrobacter freundii]